MATKKEETVVEAKATEAKAEAKAKKYLIEVTTNKAFCGVGAGGVQFANGKAVIGEGTMVEWFRTHKGYKVTEAE